MILISDPRSVRSWSIKWNRSIITQSIYWFPLMHHDPDTLKRIHPQTQHFINQQGFLHICSSLFCCVFWATNFLWSKDHDVLFCRQVLVTEPYQHKLRSIERGRAWEQVAEHLNAITELKFRVTPRSV